MKDKIIEILKKHIRNVYIMDQLCGSDYPGIKEKGNFELVGFDVDACTSEIEALYTQQIGKYKELVNWLNSECPKGTMTFDLSHNFAEKLRERLNELKKELV